VVANAANRRSSAKSPRIFVSSGTMVNLRGRVY
jgi:hypothetical protein